jgi:hypothetical protein
MSIGLSCLKRFHKKLRPIFSLKKIIIIIKKAYAKLYSCYELLEGGFEEDGMVDMTGGVVELFDLTKIIKKQKTNDTKNHNINVLWKMINKSFKMGSVCATGIWSKSEEKERERNDGLLEGVYKIPCFILRLFNFFLNCSMRIQ